MPITVDIHLRREDFQREKQEDRVADHRTINTEASEVNVARSCNPIRVCPNMRLDSSVDQLTSECTGKKTEPS